jgi:caa(3)-type oxidase subunit IV
MADAHADPHASHAAPGHHDHHEEHIHETSYYLKVYGALLVLFAISVLGPVVGIWWLTLITAFGIAAVKASLVVKFFMHLDVEQRFIHYFLVTSVLLMFLFFFAVAPDVMNHRGDNWENVAAQQEVQRGLAAGEGHGGHDAPAGEGAGHH